LANLTIGDAIDAIVNAEIEQVESALMDGLRRAAPDKIMIGPVSTTHALGSFRSILIIAVLDGRLDFVENV
jgi:hypothetical protein